MATTSSTPTVTAEEFEFMDDAEHYEFVGGRLVERNVSEGSEFVGWIVSGLLYNHVRPRRLGRAYASGLGYRIFSNPEETRRADVSFISAARVPKGDPGYVRIPPELVVEVISPGDKAIEVQEKVDEWLAAGVRLVWVVYPRTKEVHVYRAGGKPSILLGEDELTGEEAVPGFACRVSELFPGE